MNVKLYKSLYLNTSVLPVPLAGCLVPWTSIASAVASTSRQTLVQLVSEGVWKESVGLCDPAVDCVVRKLEGYFFQVI